MVTVDTHTFLKFYWTAFNFLGVINPTRNLLYFLYSIALHLSVTILFPVHLALYVSRSDSYSANIQNLGFSISTIAHIFKFAHNALRQRELRELEQMMTQMDARATSVQELQYYWNIRKEAGRIRLGYCSIFILCGMLVELKFLFSSERTLVLPAYIPFDWRASTWKFCAAHAYQLTGIVFMVTETFCNDFMPPTILAILAGHIQLLGIRVAQIGYEQPEDYDGNEMELLRCIKDQKCIFRMLDCVQRIISVPVFLQLMVSTSSICLSVAAIAFHVDNSFERVFFVVYSIFMIMQIFLSCFYATHLVVAVEQLHFKIFACNWPEQSRTFRKHMLLFCERLVKEHTLLAGGFVPINLRTFMSTLKSAYSLLAVIFNINK